MDRGALRITLTLQPNQAPAQQLDWQCAAPSRAASPRGGVCSLRFGLSFSWEQRRRPELKEAARLWIQERDGAAQALQHARRRMVGIDLPYGGGSVGHGGNLILSTFL